jgi:hypothetical protein
MKAIVRCLLVLAASVPLQGAVIAQSLLDTRSSILFAEDTRHFQSALNFRIEVQAARDQAFRCSGCESGARNLGASIAGTAKAGVVEQGVTTAKEAIEGCLKGDYPGGGMGLLSLPSGRESARTSHCQR